MIKQTVSGTRFFLHIVLGVLLLVLTGAIWNNKTFLVKRTKQWWCAHALRILRIEVEVEGTLPSNPTGNPNQGMLFVSNHISWTDIPLIGGYVQLNFLSKAEVRKWPIIGTLAQGVGTLFIQRGSGDASLVAHQIANYLEEGRNVLIFPEGTTTPGREVKPFHSKLLQAARHTTVTLCPIAIRYQVKGSANNPVAFIGEDAFTTHLWKVLKLPLIKATLTFLPARALDPANLTASASQARADIQAIIQQPKSSQINTNTQWPDASSLDAANDKATSF